MPDIRAQVILKNVNGIVADHFTNSWAFRGDDTVTETVAITAALKGFYDDLIPNTLSNFVAQNNHDVKFYDLPGTPPNYPFEETTFNLSSAPSAESLPTECALVTSFQGTRTPGFPQARRRGRLYIGPVKASGSSSGRPSSTVINELVNATEDFRTAINAITGDVQWCVWSVADQLMVEISDGWVDNAWDTQRRRGLSATTRTTWP